MYLFSLVPYMIINCVHIVLWMKRQGATCAHAHVRIERARTYSICNRVPHNFTQNWITFFSSLPSFYLECISILGFLLLCLLISLASFHYSYSKGFLCPQPNTRRMSYAWSLFKILFSVSLPFFSTGFKQFWHWDSLIDDSLTLKLIIITPQPQPKPTTNVFPSTDATRRASVNK